MEVFTLLFIGLGAAGLVHSLIKRGRIASVKARLAILPEQFVIVDLETTGLDPGKHEIIEIGAIRVNRDSDHHTALQVFVKPQRKIPKRIIELTGITAEIIEREGQSLAEAMRQFRDFSGDLRLVTFNAEFDMAFLHRAADACGMQLHNPVSCALRMSRRAWPGRRSYRLSSLAKDGGLDLNNEHRAIGDCKRAMLVYTAAVARLGRIE